MESRRERRRFMTVNYGKCLLLCGWFVSGIANASPPTTRPTEGLRDKTPGVHALRGARVFVAPGQVIDAATIVIRDGIIVSVRKDGPVPAEAREWDASGQTIYPGLIDSFSEVSIDPSTTPRGAAHSNGLVTPQWQVARTLGVDAARNKELRSQGITASLAAPDSGIFKGQSCLLTTSDDAGSETILKSAVAQHLQLTLSRSPRRDRYPNSPMGVVALVRQTLLDANWYRDAWRIAHVQTTLPRPERNDALAALDESLRENELFIIDSHNDLYFLRADRLAREFGLNAAIRGSGREYRRLEQVVAAGRTVILPVNFVKPPNVSTIESARHVSLEDLLHWDYAPENPARLDDAGVRITLCTHGLKDVKEFLAGVRKAVSRGLSRDAALRALTIEPAALFGVEKLVGTIEPGKLANFTITNGDLFADSTKVLSTWIRGEIFEVENAPLFDARGNWEVVPEGQMGDKKIWLRIRGDSPLQTKGEVFAVDPQSVNEVPDDKKANIEHLIPLDMRLTLTFDSGCLGNVGRSRIALTAQPLRSTESTWQGEWILPDETRLIIAARRIRDLRTASSSAAAADNPVQPPDRVAMPRPAIPLRLPFGSYGRLVYPLQESAVVFENATIWTCGPQGILEDVSLLVQRGKVTAIGRELTIPSDAIRIDCRGKYLSPGIIDCHSHMATDGGVNETGRGITAQVRVGDFIEDTDISIYRQLAGGVTCAHVLHGSANPIGGQCQVIKLRWGAAPEEMKMTEAPATIKFALGENVKQSNWAERSSTRYPQTRMGVEQIFRDEFQAAVEYRQRWRDWERDHLGLPPRRDLELDAIVEILEHRRWIHCHSYRQDEILAFLRVAEEFGIRIACLQHILEGYKVADQIRKHGATGSSFSDWWAYKCEVIDAIPYNGAIMHRAGVVVSFNSDDRELARHLNQEAAKAVRYGGVPVEEAFQFVTLNPAKQLMIDQYVGSLEVGKDADIVVWSAPPLSNFARPEQTWVDGRRMFDLDEDRQLRQDVKQLRMTLVQRILESGEKMRELGQDFATEQDDLWPREDEFCHGHPH